MSKRKADDDLEGSEEFNYEKILERKTLHKKYTACDEVHTIQHTLDSDEEDVEEAEEKFNVMHRTEFDLIGVEAGPSVADADTKFTPFNLREEMNEGYFDKDGTYHWKKDEEEVKDHWLDNIDWTRVQQSENGNEKKRKRDSGSDSEDMSGILFDPTPLYKQILEFLQPGETISKALRRLGGGKKLTTAERWKRKKDPQAAKEDEENSKKITKLTELSNELLTRTGNMDIYQESYEQIQKKIAFADKHSTKVEAESDMFSDDFSSKEEVKNPDGKSAEEQKSENNEDEKEKGDEKVSWELKWSQEDDAKIHGPHTSEQMYNWAKEGFFKKGAWVKRNGQSDFYSAARIDFELYM